MRKSTPHFAPLRIDGVVGAASGRSLQGRVRGSARTPLFGAFPERGVWTAIGLGRGQFLAILALATAFFLFVGGPVWAHLHEDHFARITVSYGVIPLATALALHRNGNLRLGLCLGASLLIALLKLLVTAALLIALALGR
jgi:hypothetical protein